MAFITIYRNNFNDRIQTIKVAGKRFKVGPNFAELKRAQEEGYTLPRLVWPRPCSKQWNVTEGLLRPEEVAALKRKAASSR